MKCKIEPFSHRVIVEERPAETQVKGIIMPESLKDRAQAEITEGVIVDMADDAFDFLLDNKKPKIGDVIHFIKYDGIGKCYNKKNYRILHDESVWGRSEKYIKLEEDLVYGET